MKKLKVGLQLYSIREEMKNDMDAALRKVKEIGYDYVEFAGYFGRSAEEVRMLLDKYRLQCVSVHQTLGLFLEEGQKAVDYLKTIGAKFCAIPWYEASRHKGSELWPETIELFTGVGRILKDNGIQLLYHNHDYEFEKYEDKFLLDWLYETIPADVLQPELDTCWVKYAGYDPSEYILKYTGRISVVHLKDFVCRNFASSSVYALIGEDVKKERKASREENGFEFRPLGCGIQNIPQIIEASSRAGAEYIIVEQDASPDRPAMEAVKISREYLKTSCGI